MSLRLTRPDGEKPSLRKTSYTWDGSVAGGTGLRAVGDSTLIDTAGEVMDSYAAALELTARYRLDYWSLLDELRRLYPGEDIPIADLEPLSLQIEELKYACSSLSK
jgi:hypothetical protein